MNPIETWHKICIWKPLR